MEKEEEKESENIYIENWIASARCCYENMVQIP